MRVAITGAVSDKVVNEVILEIQACSRGRLVLLR